MISTFDRYKRVFSFIALLLLLFIAAAAILEQEIEGTGSLTLVAAFVALMYLPISWLLKRYDYLSVTSAWVSKEVWAVLMIIGGLSLLGAIESFFVNTPFTVLFAIPFFTILFLGALHFSDDQIRQSGRTTINRKALSYWAFGCFTIGTFLLLIVLEHFDNQEALVFTGLFYFPTLFFLVLRWIFRQIRLIISLKNEQARTELLHLKSQVNPHFFFNMLNNLYGLVGKDAEKARELILKLSDMMRYSIYEGQREAVTLAQEIDYLKNYIELHKMRYHKTIKIDFNTQIEQADRPIMPLLFIILLENAFKHGVEKLRKDAFVAVNITSKTKAIYFSVRNNFDTSTDEHTDGIGLKNLKRRLELVYPDQHQLSFSVTKNVYQAELVINI